MTSICAVFFFCASLRLSFMDGTVIVFLSELVEPSAGANHPNIDDAV
jgi:hypothetical protein